MIIPKALDNPWLDDDPSKRQQVIEAYRHWLWEHLEINRMAMEEGLDGGECDYGLIDPSDIEPILPLDPEWERDDENGAICPTWNVARQFFRISWKATPEEIDSLLQSEEAHLIVIGRAIRWSQSYGNVL